MDLTRIDFENIQVLILVYIIPGGRGMDTIELWEN
jgi:hypothetical protein